MLEIFYLGHAAFKIKTANATVIIDPFDPKEVGLPWKNQEADLVLTTHEHADHHFLQGVNGSPLAKGASSALASSASASSALASSASASSALASSASASSAYIISGPGEYEVKGVQVFGIPAFHDKNQGKERGPMTLYLLEVEGVHLAHLGNLGHLLEEKQISELENVDILILPTGGFSTINPKEAVQIVTELEPSIVVPMHYLAEGMDPKYAEKGFAPVSEFLKAMGTESKEPVEKIKVKSADDLPQETEVVVMKRTS